MLSTTPLNLDRALKAGGSSLRDVIKVTIFVTDTSNFDQVVALRGEFFSPPYPADSIVEVKIALLARCDDRDRGHCRAQREVCAEMIRGGA